MADEAPDAEDKTEAASPKRLQKAREEGRIPVSREMVAFAGLATATLAFALAGPHSARGLALRLQPFLSGTHPDGLGGAVRDAAWAASLAVLPLALPLAVAAMAAVLLQTGGAVKRSALVPDLSRLDPRRGLKRVVGKENGIEAAKAVVKLLALGWAAWRALGGSWQILWAAPLWTPAAMLDRLLREVVHLLLLLLAAQAAIALLDWGWQRWQFAKSMRMTRQEAKEEHRESEGDPHVKARLKKLRMARSRKRMMASIPKAAVVVTNPTHYAVALAYDRGASSAPRVVAKGMDEVAARIREVAREHRVPLVSNPPLARALFRVELDAEIPGEHFQAVAEIIAYVWRLRARARPVPAQPAAPGT